MKLLFSYLTAYLLQFLAMASDNPSLGVVITEIKVKTMFSDNGFYLKTSYDKDVNDYVLSSIRLHWGGKEIDIDKTKLPILANPSLAHVRINGLQNKNDTIILIIPYDYVKSEKTPVVFNRSHDAIQIIFTNGSMVNYSTAVAINKERNKWIISRLDTATNKLAPYSTVNAEENPLLE